MNPLCLLVVAAASAIGPAVHAGDTPAAGDAAVRLAIADAVRLRMGAGIDVHIDDLVITAVAPGAVQAVPEPGAMLGAVTRFRLVGADAAAAPGAATARITAVVPHAHTTRAVERGVTLTDADVAEASHAVADGPLRAWPLADAAAGGRVLRPLAAGACVARTAVAVPPAVRTGQDVLAVARVGAVEAKARLVAADSGDAGAVIRVVNRQSRRSLKARVIGAGLVEILP